VTELKIMEHQKNLDATLYKFVFVLGQVQRRMFFFVLGQVQRRMLLSAAA
jgi:hypothetical protein